MKKNIATTILLAAAFALTASIARADDGKTLFDRNCASCHGKDGKGDTKMGKKEGVKDYSDAKSWEGLDDAKATKAVKEGLVEDGKTKMKPFGEKLSDDDIKAVIEYMKTLKQ